MGLIEEIEQYLQAEPQYLEISERPHMHYTPGKPYTNDPGLWWRTCEYCGHTQGTVLNSMAGTMHLCKRDEKTTRVYWPQMW